MQPFPWSPWLAYVAGVVSLLAALLVLVASPRKPTNRALSALVFLVGANPAIFLLTAVVPGRTASYNITLLADGFQLSAILVYLLFLGYAIDSPLVRPWRTTLVRRLLLVGSLACLLVPYVLPLAFWNTPEAVYEGDRYLFTPGPGDRWANVATVITSLFAVAAAVHAMVRCPVGSSRRAYASAYVGAFLVLDVTLILSEIVNVGDMFGASLGTGPYQRVMFSIVYPAGAIVFAFLLTRVLVKRQLFDFDLKVKWTVRRGTLVGAFIVVFLVAKAIAEQYLQQYGYVFGGLAAGVLLFAVRPIERAADRLADRAMPQVQPTPAYIQFKKLDVYRAAVESAFEEGFGIDDRERRTLDRLRGKLELAAQDASALEAEVASRYGSRTGPSPA